MAKSLVECFKLHGKGLNAAEMQAVTDMANAIQKDGTYKDKAPEYPNVVAVTSHIEELQADRDSILTQLGVAIPAGKKAAPVKAEADTIVEVKPTEKPAPKPRTDTFFTPEFAERNIPKLEAKLEEVHKALWDSEAFADSDFYDGSFPIPKKGGIIATKGSKKYKTDKAYRTKVDSAVKNITDTMVDANKKRMILIGQPRGGAFGVDYSVTKKRKKVRAKYTVDVIRAWNNEARTKYPNTDYLGDIAVREGLQNSLDAVLDAIAAKQIKKGDINISANATSYTLTDNGIGMSDTDIAEKFLALHGTGKDKEGRFGGFGIAKAVILGPSDSATWTMETRDNLFTHEMASNNDVVGALDKPRQGTQIHVETQDGIIGVEAKKYVETTETPKNISITFNGEKVKSPFGKRKAKTFAGTIGDKSSYDIKYYPNAPEGYENKLVIRLVDKKTGAKLTQAIVHIYNENFNGTLVQDITTSAAPSEHAYPLTDSRMGLKWDGRAEVDKIVGEFAVDKQSVARSTIETNLYGVYERPEWKKTLRKVKTDKGYQNLTQTINDIWEETGKFFGHRHYAPFTALDDMDILVDIGYKGSRGGSLFQAKHVAAYEAVARLMAKDAGALVGEFSLMLSKPVNGGIVESQYQAATGNLWINHLSIDKTSLKSPVSYAQYLKGLVDHELTHFWRGPHDEDFSSARESTQRRTAEMWPYILRIAEATLGKQDKSTTRTKTKTVVKEKIVEKTVEVDKIIERYLDPQQLEFNFDNFEKEAVDGQIELYLPEPKGGPRQGRLFGRAVDRSDSGQHRKGRPDGDRRGAKQSDTQGTAEGVTTDVGDGKGRDGKTFLAKASIDSEGNLHTNKEGDGVFFVGADMVDVDFEGNRSPEGVRYPEVHSAWTVGENIAIAIEKKSKETFKTIAVVAYPQVLQSMQVNPIFHAALIRALSASYGKKYAKKMGRQAKAAYAKNKAEYKKAQRLYLREVKKGNKPKKPILTSFAQQVMRLQPTKAEAKALQKNKIIPKKATLERVYMQKVAEDIAVRDHVEIAGKIVGVGRYKSREDVSDADIYDSKILFESYHKFDEPVSFSDLVKQLKTMKGGKVEATDKRKIGAWLMMRSGAFWLNKRDSPVIPAMVEIGKGGPSVLKSLTDTGEIADLKDVTEDARTVVHYANGVYTFLVPAEDIKDINSYTTDDFVARRDAGTKKTPAQFWTGAYDTGGVRKEEVVTGTPHATKIQENKIYDSTKDALGYREKARKWIANDPGFYDTSVGGNTLKDMRARKGKKPITKAAVDNAMALLLKRDKYKGFSYTQTNGKWFALFGKIPAKAATSVKARMSAVVGEVESPGTDIDKVAAMGHARATLLKTALDDLAKKYPELTVRIEAAKVSLASFDAATEGQVEYGIDVDIAGPMDGIRAFLSEGVGLSNDQLGVIIESSPEDAIKNGVSKADSKNALTFNVPIDRKYTRADVRDAIKQYGLKNYNILESSTTGAVSINMSVDLVKKADGGWVANKDRTEAIWALNEIFKEIGGNGTLDINEVYSEVLGDSNYSSLKTARKNYREHIEEYHGKTRGGKIYEKAVEAGKTRTNDIRSVGPETFYKGRLAEISPRQPSPGTAGGLGKTRDARTDGARDRKGQDNDKGPGVTLSMSLGGENPTRWNPKELKRITQNIKKRVLQILPESEVDRVKLVLTTAVNLSGKNARKSKEDWQRIDPKLTDVTGSASVNLHESTIQVALNFDKPTIDRTALHEPFHVVMENYLPKRDYDFLLKKYGNAETAVETGVDYFIGKGTPTGRAKRIFDYLKRLLASVRNGLKGLGFTSENQIFEKVWRKGYEKRQSEATRAERLGIELEKINEFAQPAETRLSKAIKKITDNPAFNKWFGKSKVVDEKGEPLVVYHGTRSQEITEFNESKSRGGGFWFTPSKRYAKQYTHGNGSIVEVYLKIENPLNLDSKAGSAISKNLHKRAVENGSSWEEEAIKDGYDGSLIFGGFKKGGEIKVFNPTQIKSIYNQGTFSQTSPNIMLSMSERRAEEAGGEEYATNIGKAMSLPDIVWLAKELMGGKYPDVVKGIASRKGKSLGNFTRTRNGRIKILASLFKNPLEASKVLAHEIGHLSDWLPNKDMGRGNIFGRIATLHNYFKRTLPKGPNEIGELSDADRVRLRAEAKKVLSGEKTIDEEIITETPVTPAQVLSIWNSVENGISEELLDYVKRLDAAEKKSIIKEAMKGQVPAELRRFATIVKIKTGKKIKIKLTPSEDQIKTKYEDLIKEEIKKRKLFTLSEVMDELKAFSRLWSPFDPAADPAYTKYRYSSKELYADAFSAIIMAPNYAEEQIPTFVEGFFNYLERKPELKKMYDTIQDQIKHHGSLEALDKRVGEGMKRGSDDWVSQVRNLKKKLFSKELWGNTFLGRDFSLLMRVKKARNRSPILHDPFNKSMDPTNAIDDMRYTTTEVNGYIKDMFAKVVKGYEAIGMNDIDFSKYLLYRRIVGEKTEKQAWSEGVTKKEAAVLKAQYEERFGPKLKEIAGNFSKVRKEWVLDKLKANSKYATADLVKYIEDNLDSYATIDIYDHMNEKTGVSSSAGLFSTPLKTRVGSLKSTRPVFSATLENDMAIINAVNKSIAARSVADFMTEYDPDSIKDATTTWDGKKRVINPPSDRDMGLIVYMDNGKMVGKYVPKYVAEFFHANPVQSQLLTQIFRWTATPFKAIFTGRNPGFWPFNMIRDYHRAARTLPGKGTYLSFSKYWVKNVKKAAKSAFDKEMTDAERQMLHDKSLLSVMNYQGDESHDAMTERILSRHGLIEPKHNNPIFKGVRKFFHVLDALGMTSERVTKFAANEYLETNFPEMSQQERAFIIRRTGSPSFLTQGTATPLLNNILIFSNPMIQGYREDINFAKDRPIETLFKIGAIVMLPKMLMMAAASGLFGDDWEEAYARISEYDKSNYLCIPFGITPNGKVAYLRLPQDEMSRVIGGTLWKMFSSEKKRYLQNLEDYMGGQVPSLSPVWDILSGISNYRNGLNIYTPFRGNFVFTDQLMSAAKGTGIGSKEAKAKKWEVMRGWMSNTVGGGIFYRFNSNNVETVKTTTEKVIGYPVLSNIVGRFIKVSDYGKREELRKDKSKIRSNNDAVTLLAYDAITKAMNNEQPNRNEMIALVVKYKSLPRMWKKLVSQKFTNVYVQEIINAKSKEEKTAVGIRMQEDKFSRRMLDGGDRKGIKFLNAPDFSNWVRPTEEGK